MITITVTEDDIKKGCAGSNCACPIALAAARVFGGVVNVANTRIHVDGKIYLLPMEARIFVRGFDTGCVVKPLTFNIGAP